MYRDNAVTFYNLNDALLCETQVSISKGYRAVEMGMHGFHNINEPGAPVHYAKFAHIWKRNNGKWQITKGYQLGLAVQALKIS